jgi:hypothetical protein
MALTRLDNLYSSKTGRYLYVSPDDFNATDELDNRGNSPLRPFKTIQRAFIEVSRYSYLPGKNNDRFDQFSIMLMPGNHYIDNRPGLVNLDVPVFNFNQALGEWDDNSIIDLSNPDNVLYKFNASSGGAIVPRGCSLIGYDLRRTIVRPLYVPDPVDGSQERTSIFNLTGGCYLWQFTIKDGDLSSNSPLYDESANVGKVYYQKGNDQNLIIPEYSHHKICIMTYADNKDLDLYYEKVGVAFSKFQPSIDSGDLEALVQENRIVGPLSDTRSIESIRPIDSTGRITFRVTTKIDHGYFEGQYVAILNSGLADDVNGTFKITKIDQTNQKVFEYEILDKVSAAFNLTSNQVYTSANGLNTNAVAQAEIDSVESASPYVFNCSIRSTWGQCGMWADGSKATGFKSMVVAQYTGVSLQKDDRAFIRYDKFSNTWNQASLRDAFATVPYHTKGDAYWKDDWRNFHIRASDDSFIQCVSVFAVGFFDHFLMESGGDMSITNSNSNFGNTSLHATGFKGFAFNQDKGGYITDIIPPKSITGGYSDDPTKDSFNSTKVSYYPFDVKASNDATNHNKLYIGSDTARNPNVRPAATLGGYRIGARSDERIFVTLEPLTSGGPNKFYATLNPTGFRRFTVSLDTLNPSGIEIDNYAQDASNSIEANRLFIQQEAYGYIIQKYPYLLTKPDIDITKCRRDIGYFVDAVVSDLRLGGNVNTIQAAEAYYIGNQLAYIVGEKSETIETLDYVKNLTIAAMRNFDVLIKNCVTTANSALVNVGSTSGLVVGMTVAEYDPSNFTDGKLNFGVAPIISNIRNNTFIKRIVDGTTIELGVPGSKLNQGDLRPALLSSGSAFLYFTLPQGAWATATPSTNDNLIQDTEYPECANVASTIEGYFDNVKTIINVGVDDNGVIKIESDLETSKLASRCTLFTINTSNPHDLETGTPVRLVPKAREGTNPDKRVIRLPKEFDTNAVYYVIAPGRTTNPENYANTTLFGGVFDGTDQRNFMLARSKENASAGIYIYSPETDSMDSDIEIEVQQYLLDENYSLHKYKCNLAGSGVIETDVNHIFDLPANGVTPQAIFFRQAEDIIGSQLPEIAGQGIIESNTYFYPRYLSAKRISVHRSYADAVAGVNAINFSPNSGSNFYIYADKRISPLKFDAAFVDGSTSNNTGLWYLGVKDESSSGNERNDSVLYRLHQPDYADDAGKIRTNDTWYERVLDDRKKEDRAYRLRYVIPNYLQTVRDPLNGFVIKVRTDDKRKLRPQRALLKPIGGAVSVARFFNPAQQSELLGLRENEYGAVTPLYDSYFAPKIITSQRTQSKISFSIQSAKKVTIGGTDYLEIVAFDHGITNEALKNEQFTVVSISAPQAGSFTLNSQITWAGFSSGVATVQGYFTVGGKHYLIIRGVISGNIEYNSLINTRFTQGAAFADLIAKPDSVGDPSGKSKSSKEDYLYRTEGANVYTLVPGDVITDDTDNQYFIEKVEDVEEIEDTFYIFDVDEIRQRIPNQQDGIYYLTCVRGNISPFPTGAGVGDNFKNFKFSQPISQLYPQNYKNDPFWYRQIDPNANDAPATTSAADNFIHGLVTVNDAKFSETKESTIDLIQNPILKKYSYTNTTTNLDGAVVDNRIRAQEGNASAGAEDRKINIAGDSKFPLEQKLYVELRRPSIARSGNHTFEYLGFGPGNYSTGFPLRQEVLLSDKQDFYAQAKREDGGIVFYTGLNSNGDLYIGNRKINAITGEETFLEQAALIDAGGDDDDDTGGSLVTTFDTPVTFNDRITVLGDATFTNPVEINVEADEGVPLTIYSKVLTEQDVTLSRSSFRPNSKGDITIGNNRINSAIFGVTPRSLVGLEGQGYSIRTHFASGAPSNITPNNSKDRFSDNQSSNRLSDSQIVQFGNQAARSGDILFKGERVGNSGSLGWILANSYNVISENIDQIIVEGTSEVQVVLKSTVTNEQIGVASDSQVRITQFSNFLFNGIWNVKPQGFVATSNQFTIIVPDITTFQIFNWEDQGANARFEVGNSNWKEVGVIGSEAIRTNTDILGRYRVGINTIARSNHQSLTTGFVSSETNPRANLDVVGTTFISGKTIENYRGETGTDKTETAQNNAFIVGGDSVTPNNKATLRVATTNDGRLGINATNAQLDRELVVIGSGRITGDFRFQSDIEVNGGDITTTSSSFTVANQTTLSSFSAGASASTATLFNAATGNQTINIGTSATQTTTLNVHTSSTNSTINIGTVPNTPSTTRSNITIGGAFSNPSQSIFRVRNFRTIFDGRLTLRGGFIEVDESINTFTLFPDGLNELKIAGSAGIVEIGGVAGRTTIRHGLKVLGSSVFESDMTQNGGFRNSNVGIERNVFGNINIAAVSRSGNVATITTTSAHQLSTGESVTVRSSNETFNTATPTLVTVVNATTFTYSNVGTFVSPNTPATGRVIRPVGSVQTVGSLQNLNIDYYALVENFAEVLQINAVIANKLIISNNYFTLSDPIVFIDTGSLAGVSSNQTYFVKQADSSGITLSDTLNGNEITITLLQGFTDPGSARIQLQFTVVDTLGDEFWGNIDFENPDGSYRLPLNNSSNITTNQLYLIGNEIVRTISDPTSTRPFTVNVLRAQEGTVRVSHPDGAKLNLLLKQENASYIFPSPITATDTSLNIGELSAFLRVGDLFRLNEGTLSEEYVRITQIDASDAQSLVINNGDFGTEFNPKNPLELFKVISTTGNTQIIGDVTIGYDVNIDSQNSLNDIALSDAFGRPSSTSTGATFATSGGGNLKVHNSIELSGNTSTTTPGKQYFVITNGTAPRFYVESASGNTSIYNGGNFKVFKDSFFADGRFDKSRTNSAINVAFEIIGQSGNTKVAGTLRAGGDFTVGTLQNPNNAETGLNAFTTRFSVDAQTGDTVVGRTLLVEGTSSATPSEAVNVLRVNRLGVNGVDTFNIKQDRSIDAFGQNRFYNKNGGRKTLFISSQGNTHASAFGTDTNQFILVPNLQYIVRPSSTLILRLPSEAVTGDIIRIVDAGGALNFAINLVVRAPSGVRIQGRLGGSTLGGLGSEYGSGELVVNTPNAAFGLIYVGDVDGNNVGIAGEQQGWYLMEI